MELEAIQASLKEANTSISKVLERMDADDAARDELTVAFEKLQTTQKTQDAWLREVEALAKRRAEPGIDGRNNLLEAIPAKLRHQCAIAEMAGKKDPIVYAAHSIWLQRELMRQGAMSQPDFYRECTETVENIKKAFGAQLVSQAVLGETTTGTGVELILTPVEAEILRQIQDNSYIRSVARVMPMTSKEHKIPSLDTDFIAYFTAAGATISDSASATNFSQKSLAAKKLAGLATIDSELLQDSAIAVADFVYTAVAEQIGRLEDTEALEGTGTNWTGVNSASGVNAIAAGTDGDPIAYKSKLVKAIFLAQDVDSRQNAAWFMNPLGAVECFGLVDTNGQPILHIMDERMASVMPTGARGTLLGYPVFSHSGIRANRTKGSGTNLTNIYFGNWKKLIVGDLLGLTFATDPYSLFSSDQVKVRVTKRTGVVVGVPKSFTVIKDIKTT